RTPSSTLLPYTTLFRSSLVTAAGYAGSFYCLSLTLKVLPIGVVYAIWSGVGIVLTAVVGWFIFKQRLDAAAIGGMALIVAGVLRSEEHTSELQSRENLV